MNEYFKLYSCCIPVNGKHNSLIYDLQRGSFYRINNQLFNILESIEEIPKKELLEINPQIIDSLEELRIKEIGFWCRNPKQFPKISEDFDSPHIIENCVLEYKTFSDHDPLIFKYLNDLLCRNLLMQFHCKPTLNELLKILDDTLSNNIFFIELWFNENCNFNLIKKVIKKYINVRVIRIFNTKKKYKLHKQTKIFYYSYEKFEDFCKNEDVTYISDLKFYNESLKFNNCLNKKLSIDSNGNVKNCFYLDESFGNYKSRNLIDIVKSKEFQRIWGLNKDKIEECQDCEYRYACLDCRAFTVEKNVLSKPSFCNFRNPEMD